MRAISRRAPAGLRVAVTTAPRRALGWSTAHPRAAALLLSALTLVLLGAVITFSVLNLQARSVTQARLDARAAAEDAVPVLLSYDHRTLGSEIDARADRLTGDFRDDYATLIRDVVLPASQEGALLTVTELVAAGAAEDARADRVTLLMFLNQVTGPEGEEPTVSGSRVRVTMERPDDRWLVSELTPV